MKKMIVAAVIIVMVLALAVSASAAGNKQAISLEQARQAALKRAGVAEAQVQFTKAYQDWDDGRQTYEFEFWAGNTEYDVEVDALTGRIRDYDMERHGRNAGYGWDDDDFDLDDFLD